MPFVLRSLWFLCIPIVLFGLAGCQTASAPSPLHEGNGPASALGVTGVWSGELRVTECAGLRHCWNHIGAREPFTLRLQQHGTTVSGLFVTPHVAVDVAGPFTAGGDIQLSGNNPSPAGSAYDMRVQELVVRWPDGRGLTGHVRYAQGYESSPGFPAVAVLAADVVSEARAPLEEVGRIDGTWAGTVVIRTCEPRETCEISPRPDPGFLLVLAQSGDAVTGSLGSSNAMPVEGSYAAGVLRLRGESSHSNGGWRYVHRLIDGRATRSPLGRLSGTFAFVDEEHFPGGMRARTYEIELWNVTLDPPPLP